MQLPKSEVYDIDLSTTPASMCDNLMLPFRSLLHLYDFSCKRKSCKDAASSLTLASIRDKQMSPFFLSCKQMFSTDL
jgi:hypothetical protein